MMEWPYIFWVQVFKMKRISKNLSEKSACKLAQKAAFSQFIESLFENKDGDTGHWKCCANKFFSIQNAHKHVATNHMEEVGRNAISLNNARKSELQNSQTTVQQSDHCGIDNSDLDFQCSCNATQHVVLLFYHYVAIKQCDEICEWQKKLGESLKLTGKIRIAHEGINGTVEGCPCATRLYQNHILRHPVFTKMVWEDFKSSEGDGKGFDDLKVSVCLELCTMGIPTHLSEPSDGGKYLSPEQLHHCLENAANITLPKKESPLLLDCRNFYESKIGHFEGALQPDLRKFSYFPEYVDSNRHVFDDRNVIMYCTGGIRCERASAYLKQTTNCSEVFQLKGGIHRYIEKYPNGYFKGKLFVFDNRYSIGGKDSTPVSECRYCNKPFDSYQLCTTNGCRQLVLICEKCRSSGHTTCCVDCKQNAGLVSETKQCACTRTRSRVKVENLS